MESPQSIGKFRVLRLLGQGAMGQVFLAEDPLIDRKVAIKVMTAEGDDEARERFRNEARTAGQLSHPNIVQLHEFGFHQGQPYLVMEHMVGESLDLWLTRKQPLKARLSVLLDLCRAIGHAHSRGVLHRDVKPSNLQVLPDGVCKLMDFGIARSHSVRLTATGMILGTPEFIAPEVLQDAGYSDRSDLFAVGLVAYQVLTGVSPFHADTLEGCLTRVLTHEPPPLAEACPDVPTELSDAVSSYLCKVPEGRPAGVRPLMAALQGLQDRTLRLESAPPLATAPPLAPASQPQVATEAPTIREKARPTTRGRRLLPAAALLAVLAAAGLAAALYWRPWSGPDPVAEINEIPPPAVAGAPPAAEVGPQNDDGDDESAGTSTASASSPAPPASDALVDSSPADGRTDTDPGPAEVEATESESRDPVEQSLERTPGVRPRFQTTPGTEGSGQKVEPQPPPSDHNAAPAPPERKATPEQGSGETGESPASRPPAAQDAPEGASTAQPTAGETSAAQAAPGRGPTGVSTRESSDAESSATPRIDRLEPIVVRRGSKTALRITGSGFGLGTRAVIRRGGRPVRALRMLRNRVEGTSTLSFTLLVDRQLPLGTYMVIVVDASGRESNPFGLEVGL